jgi:hypothetical protein
MACAEVAMAKAKAATATNLIISFSPYYPFEEQDAQPLRGGWTPQRVWRARREGKDRREQTTSSARRGDYRRVMWPLLQTNGKPYKELVKIAHPPIIRRLHLRAVVSSKLRGQDAKRLFQGNIQWITRKEKQSVTSMTKPLRKPSKG